MAKYEIKDGVCIIPEGTTKVFVDYECREAIREVVIPSSVTEIEKEAFYECRNLEKVVIPDSVKKIGQQAFTRCGKLKSVCIPDSVTEIGYAAFSWCI